MDSGGFGPLFDVRYHLRAAGFGLGSDAGHAQILSSMALKCDPFT